VRRHQLRVASAGLVVALSLGAAACSKGGDDTPTPKPQQSSTSASQTPSPAASPKPKPAAYDPISGAKLVDGVVMAVKIDNVAAAHPQVGIDEADMIVVERVEGNLTRLMAIFHTRFPHRVGPVRSARNTDVRFLPMFGKPALVFSGANGKVMKQVDKASVRPIERSDRDNSRPAPHNVIVDLSQLKKTPGIGKARPIGYTFGSGSQWKSATKDTRFSVPIGVDTFRFDYAGGHYQTFWNGEKYTDGDTHRAVLADNIVRLSVKSHADRQTTSDKSNVAETVGSGKVTVYSQGKRVTGTWSRKQTSGPMTLKDSHGKNIPLKPGHTWILLDG
jgi:hypothetical protein